MVFLWTLRRAFVSVPKTSMAFSNSGRRTMGTVSAIDSSIFRSLFGTDEIRKVLTPIFLPPKFSRTEKSLTNDFENA